MLLGARAADPSIETVRAQKKAKAWQHGKASSKEGCIRKSHSKDTNDLKRDDNEKKEKKKVYPKLVLKLLSFFESTT